MLATDWSLVITNSLQNLWTGVLGAVPDMVIALLVILIGWLVGVLVGRVIEQVIKGIKLDSALSKAGVDEVLRKGGINLNSGVFIGGLVKWFFIVVFLVAALDILGLSSVTELLQNIVVGYIPRVIVAALVLLFAGVLGDVVSRIVKSSVKAAGFSHTNLLAAVSKYAIWIFAILVALQQLGIAVRIIDTLFMGAVGALALALGLAFGLGGKEVAGKITSEMYKEITHKD